VIIKRDYYLLGGGNNTKANITLNESNQTSASLKY